jgi:hypothetical protein
LLLLLWLLLLLLLWLLVHRCLLRWQYLRYDSSKDRA